MTDAIKSPEAKKLPTISPQILAASEVMQAQLSIDKKTHAVAGGESLYEKILPAHLSVEGREQYAEQDMLFVAAGKHAFGKTCIEFYKGNPSVDQLTLSMPLTGSDTLDMTSKHKRDTFAPPKAGEKVKPEDKTVTYGTVTTTLNIRAGDFSSKEHRSVKENLKQMAKDLLSS